MPVKTPRLLGTTLATLIVSSGCWAASEPATQAAIHHNEMIEGAASLCEDIVDFALDRADDQTRTTIDQLRSILTTIRSTLPEPVYRNLDRLVNEMHGARTGAESTATALAAVDAYRSLIDQFDAKALATPIGVPLLDYTGSRLRVLLAAGEPDWTAIEATAGEASGDWRRLSGDVGDPSLRDLMETIESGLAESVAHQDASQLRFAAKLQLASVDVLERHYAAR